MTSVSSQVDGLSTRVDGIISSLTMLGTDVTGLEAGLMAAQAELASITAALEGVVTSEELGLISNTLADLQEDIQELLNNNAVIDTDINIIDSASLQVAETLIDTAADAPNVILDGNLDIVINATTFTAAELARINAVTEKLASVLQDISVENNQSTVTISFPNLTFVGNWLNVQGNAVEVPLLGGIGGWALFYYDGNINNTTLPMLTSIAGSVIVNKGITSLDLNGISISGSISSSGSPTGQLWLTDATSVDVATAEVTNLNAPRATSVNLGHTDDVASLTVNAPSANTVDIATDEITGTTFITAGGTSTINLNNVTKVSGTTEITAGITQMVTAQKYNGKIKRKETGIFPKYAVIASHDLRRSFATNFYSKIPTPLLMNMTGHSRETTFLKYIGLEENRDSYADDFMRSVSLLEL